MKIISVDDERWSSNLIQLMIEKLKAENPEYKNVEFVASFTGALEALEYLQSHKIDLIFLDVEMPEMTGLEFAAKVEEYYLTAKIVFITAYSQYALDAVSYTHLDVYKRQNTNQAHCLSEQQTGAVI